jgi:uncharacterized phage infection (PIP) family protein YhgE
MIGGDNDAMLAYLKNGAIPQPVKDALQKAADMKQSIADLARQISSDHDKEQAITQDQTRIDETLRTINSSSQLYSRLMEKLNDQETQLDKLRDEENQLTQKSADALKQLEDYLSNLNIG